MSARTVDWTAWRQEPEQPAGEGLRERKKRQLRRQLSDTATELFLERGFDGVRVAEIAELCGVSEKTVFNYFPTKESLILDRWEGASAALGSALADPNQSPAEAVLRLLSDELKALTSWLAAQDDRAQAASAIQRFGALIRSTPSLRAHERDMADRLAQQAAEILATRAGLPPDAPEPQIAAIALLGLWTIQFQSLGKHLAANSTHLHKAVTTDVRRAATLITTGLTAYHPFKHSAEADQ